MIFFFFAGSSVASRFSVVFSSYGFNTCSWGLRAVAVHCGSLDLPEAAPSLAHADASLRQLNRRQMELKLEVSTSSSPPPVSKPEIASSLATVSCAVPAEVQQIQSVMLWRP